MLLEQQNLILVVTGLKVLREITRDVEVARDRVELVLQAFDVELVLLVNELHLVKIGLIINAFWFRNGCLRQIWRV